MTTIIRNKKGMPPYFFVLLVLGLLVGGLFLYANSKTVKEGGSTVFSISGKFKSIFGLTSCKDLKKEYDLIKTKSENADEAFNLFGTWVRCVSQGDNKDYNSEVQDEMQREFRSDNFPKPTLKGWDEVNLRYVVVVPSIKSCVLATVQESGGPLYQVFPEKEEYGEGKCEMQNGGLYDKFVWKVPSEYRNPDPMINYHLTFKIEYRTDKEDSTPEIKEYDIIIENQE